MTDIVLLGHFFFQIRGTEKKNYSPTLPMLFYVSSNTENPEINFKMVTLNEFQSL